MNNLRQKEGSKPILAPPREISNHTMNLYDSQLMTTICGSVIEREELVTSIINGSGTMILGAAGTGKTFYIREQVIPKLHENKLKAVKLAPANRAARNLRGQPFTSFSE